MRNLRLLEQFRFHHPDYPPGNDTCGWFLVRSKRTGDQLRILATAGEGWDHVSVSLPNRCPSWPEMDQVHRLFFRSSEAAMQLHLPEAEHVNNHAFCLHLWRPWNVEIPRPPSAMVGNASLGTLVKDPEA